MSVLDAVKRLQGVSPDLGDVIDRLTLSHAEWLDRHGPLLGFAAPAPTEAVQFAAEQARKALIIDTSSSSAEKGAALLDKEAHRHEQIGRLAYWIAGYELAHGDAGNAEPMQQLGDDHFELAEGLRGQITVERREVGLMSDFVTEPFKQSANANDRQFAGERHHGRDL
jgi:hypothetical protein